MFYRVATGADSSPTWQWKSTVLNSLDILLQFLRLLRALPTDQLRVFSSTAVTASQFLGERMILLVRMQQGELHP